MEETIQINGIVFKMIQERDGRAFGVKRYYVNDVEVSYWCYDMERTEMQIIYNHPKVDITKQI
jgi:hypothetical protein